MHCVRTYPCSLPPLCAAAATPQTARRPFLLGPDACLRVQALVGGRLPSLCAAAKAQGSFECAVCIGEASAEGKLNGTFCTAADEEAYCSGQAPPSPSPATGPIRFNYTGSPQNYTVPAGVTTLNLTVAGARGSEGNNGFHFSAGGVSVGTLAVAPGQVLFVMVGGTGGGSSSTCSPAGGWNGGAPGNSGFATLGCGGGGASDIRTAVNDLHSRIIVAGGGGGPPGSGGTAGVGGGAVGGAACASDFMRKSTVPGGNQTAGGNTGQRGAGGFGVGGECASNSHWCSGGGGGWYGGAAPPKDDMDKCMGGGGGSGYIGGPGLSDATMASGQNGGPGFVEITPLVG